MQEIKATIVTALYNHSPREIIGGRGWTFDFYASPFLNLVNLGLPMIVLTHDRMLNEVTHFLSKYAIEKFTVVSSELNNFKFSDDIYRIKKNSGKFVNNILKHEYSDLENDRNTHLCLSKIYWLKEYANKNIYNSKNFFWVDAGLFHHGIFPEKYGGRERFVVCDPKFYYPSNTDNIFNPNIGNFLSKSSGFISLIHTEMPINLQIKHILQANDGLIGYMVGGLFGGNAENISIICDEFDKALCKLFKNDVLSLEEDILSCISKNINHEIYNVFKFSHWHHDIKEDKCWYGIEHGDTECFYKIFRDKFKLD